MSKGLHTAAMAVRDFIKDYFNGFWDYETPKMMVIKNKPLGVIYRAVQFLVITYFIWYVFISQKAYQESETHPESSVYTTMRGKAVHGDEVLDNVEYAHPPEGVDVISTILRREFTYDQKQGTCPEHFSVDNANCTTDADCLPGLPNFDSHGIRTGRCVQYHNYTFKTCEIMAWCPIEEYAVVREPPLVEAINFTVFIRNSIHFPKFKVLRVNVQSPPGMKTKKYLKRCHYHKEKAPYCPIFRLGYIANEARENFTELCSTGGVIGVFINWDCNLDLDPSHCKPTYTFRRLDLRKDLADSGYYYRFAKYYDKNGVESRTLIKAYGIRLDIIVHGQAGKFSVVPTIISTVTALTSVGICPVWRCGIKNNCLDAKMSPTDFTFTSGACSIICDWIMLTFIDKDEVYSERKFDEISKEVVKEPTDTIFTEFSFISSYGSNHSDLSDGVPL